MDNIIQQADPAVWQAIDSERKRQQQGLEMIASENYTSPAVLAAQGSVLTNKYAEGYPGRRYYGGCEFVDVAERLAIERVLRLFGAEKANVQPHSGAQANMAVYFACLEHGDTILAMDLAHGGHLTHGMRLNFSGKFYKIVHYGVTKSDERIDFAQVAELARMHHPKLIIAGVWPTVRRRPASSSTTFWTMSKGRVLAAGMAFNTRALTTCAATWPAWTSSFEW